MIYAYKKDLKIHKIRNNMGKLIRIPFEELMPTESSLDEKKLYRILNIDESEHPLIPIATRELDERF